MSLGSQIEPSICKTFIAGSIPAVASVLDRRRVSSWKLPPRKPTGQRVLYISVLMPILLPDELRGRDMGLPAKDKGLKDSFVVTSSRVRGLVPGTYVPLPDAHLWWLAPQR